MTYRGDDLVPLLAPAGPGMTFGQGQVIAWDSETGANTIRYRGAELTDVPILNTGEAIALKAGDVVGLLSVPGSRPGVRSYYIQGRITVPGNPDFASASMKTGAAHAAVQGFAIGTSEAAGLKVSAVLPVPAWSNKALVTLAVNARPYNNSGVTANFHTRGVITPAIGALVTTVVTVELANTKWAPVALNVTYDENPGSTITVSVVMWGDAASSIDPTPQATLNAAAWFTSTT